MAINRQVGGAGDELPARFHTRALELVAGGELAGRQVVLTGASSGIGIETARALAAAGADLVLGVRDLARGEAAIGPVRAAARGRVELRACELSDLASVRNFAAGISGPVHGLVCNAGVSKTPEAHLANGLDVRFATNHLGHFALACLLREQLAAAATPSRRARIVVVSSAAHKGMPVRLDDLNWHRREHVDGMAYAESKSANILFAQEASRRWGDLGVTANAVLPGSVLSGLQRYHGEALKRAIGFVDAAGNVSPRVKSAEAGAATSVWAMLSPEIEGQGGLVLEDCGLAHVASAQSHAWAGFDPAVADPATAAALWQASVELVREHGGLACA